MGPSSRDDRDVQAGAGPWSFSGCFGDDIAGNLREMIYPSGQRVNYEIGSANQLTKIQCNGTDIIEGLTYAPHGAPIGAWLHGVDGGMVRWFQDFNARLWPQRIGVDVDGTVGTNDTDRLFQLNYTGYENNGNITAVSRQSRPATLDALSTMSYDYSYDNLNRLKSCNYGEGVDKYGHYLYSMDRYGNLLGRTVTSADDDAPKALSQSVDPFTNRLNESADVQYDVLGNQVKMVNPAGDSLYFTYMDQGHILQVKDAAGTVKYRYYYDAAGKRRIKAMDDETFGIADNVTYSFYEGEDLICQQDRGEQIQSDEAYTPKFLLLDHLGSTRAELSFNENGNASIGRLTDMMPYGEEINPPLVESEAVKFTGKQRDLESSLDYFGARYFSDRSGRWNSADKPFADVQLANPQTWNLYIYCVNNPIVSIDSDGYKVLPPEVKTSTFKVEGKTVAEAIESAKLKNKALPGRAASTQGSYALSHIKGDPLTYPTSDGIYAIFHATSFDTQALIEVVIPEWEDYATASESEQKIWDEYISNVKSHEQEHVQVYIEGAQEVDNAVNNQTFSGDGTAESEQAAIRKAADKAMGNALKVVKTDVPNISP